VRRSAITPGQKRVLEAIITFQNRHGWPPTVRELGRLLNLTSSSTVYHHLEALERKGFIQRQPHSPRAIRVVANPDTPDDGGPR